MREREKREGYPAREMVQETIRRYGKRVDYLLFRRIMVTIEGCSLKALGQRAHVSEQTLRKMRDPYPWDFAPHTVKKVAMALGLESMGELLCPLLDREIDFLRRRGLLSEEEIGNDLFRR